MATAGRLDRPPAATRSSRSRLLRGLALGVGAILLAGVLGWALVGRLHASRSGLTGALFTDMPPAPDF